MELDLGDDATLRVSRFLRRRVLDSVPLVMSPEEFIRDGYGDDDTIAFGLGHHPEYIGRVWNKLGGDLPKAACALVSATPALVDPATGKLVAFVSGMTYMVRVPGSMRAAAVADGYRNEFDGCWPSERADPPDFGPEWFRGRFKDVEASWVRAFIAPAGSAEAEPDAAPDRRA